MKLINEPKNIEELFPLVVDEVEKIKIFFSSEEIENLDIDIEDFETDSPLDCIYGKMVGNCNDSRVTKFLENYLPICIKSDYKGDPENQSSKRTYTYMTPMEVYIYGYDNRSGKPNLEAKNRLKTVLNLLLND